MPIINHVVLASGAVVAVSVAVATAMAVYESPELRRYADEVRRRIATALYSIGDGITPPEQAPRFNRPEDADGFLLSHSSRSATEPGVDADEDSRRKQREELLYWNTMLLEKRKKKSSPGNDSNPETTAPQPVRPISGPSFDDFLRRYDDSDEGIYFYSTGTDVGGERARMRRRGDVDQGASAQISAKPSAGKPDVNSEELGKLVTDGKACAAYESGSDIYSATTCDQNVSTSASNLCPPPKDSSLNSKPAAQINAWPSPVDSHGGSGAAGYVSPVKTAHSHGLGSIEAWAHDSASLSVCSPLPMTPVAEFSEPELVSEGQLTPTTDSVSLSGPGGDEVPAWSVGEAGRVYDVMSESGGFPTPASWSEIGSVASEGEVGEAGGAAR